MIRAARADELALINQIERAADVAFHGVGLGTIADAGPMPIARLLTYQRSGRAWVATNDQDEPVAFLLSDVIGDAAHIEQVSVHPYYARQGRGRDLINHAATWAQEAGCTAVTLTTYADIPWNAPYYTKLGFHTVPEPEWSPELRRIREHETAAGLDINPRVVMRRTLTPAKPTSKTRTIRYGAS